MGVRNIKYKHLSLMPTFERGGVHLFGTVDIINIGVLRNDTTRGT